MDRPHSASPLHLRIFLSSPDDVMEERRIAARVVDALARQPLLRGQVTFEVIAYDDPDAPAPMSALETPQVSVNRYSGRPADCDLTIAILWSRLGTALPADVTREDGSRYESGTVWELEDARQAHREVWIYRRTEEPVIGLRDPRFEQKRAELAAVDEFFQRFTNADGSLPSGFNRYTTQPDFEPLIKRHLESFVRNRLELARGTEASAPSPEVSTIGAAASWNWPRPWDFSGYMAEKRLGFVGREWLFDEVNQWIGDPDGTQALLICADFGVGKSAFMAELASRNNGKEVIFAHHFCHHDTTETLNPATFVRSVAAQLAGTLSEYRSTVECDPEARHWLEDTQRDPASAFERAVVAPLRKIHAPGPHVVLIVDALDEALEFDANGSGGDAKTIVRLLAGRVNRLPAWLKVLATSRRRQDVLQPMQQWFRCQTLDAEDGRNLDDIRDYVASRCASDVLARALEAADMRASEVATFLSDEKQSGGKFLYAVRVLKDVESGALSLDRLWDLPPGMDGFYLDAFEHRFRRLEDFDPVRALLGILVSQREPTSREELTAILRIDGGQVQNILAKLEDFLSIRGRRYALDHHSLEQWLIEDNAAGFRRAGRFAVDVNFSNELIANWARREAADARAYASEYLSRHLGVYLSPQERRDYLPRLLLDFRWLDARLRAVGINALLADWAEVAATPALHALQRALRHGAHVLGHEGAGWRGAEMLASQILGRLQQRREPEVQGLCVQASEHLQRTQCLRPLTASLQSADALIRVLEGHADSVHALAVLPDGRLASGSGDDTIKLWNPADGTCDATLEGHAGVVNALAVLPDGRLASGSMNNTIKLWNLSSGACNATLEGHSSMVTALAVLPDGRLVSGSWDKTIKLWNLGNGACDATLDGHAGYVTALAVLPDGRLAAGSHDNTIKLWNLGSGACDATLEGQAWSVRALAVLPDGLLASVAWGSTIKLWNLASGACDARLEGHAGYVSALAALPDGRLASGSWDKTIKLWNPAKGACDATLEGHAGVLAALAVLPDGRLASASGDQTINLWNLGNGASGGTLEGSAGWVSALAVLPDGRLASGSGDYTIKLWNASSGACDATLEGHAYSVAALAVLTDGRLASGSGDYTIKLWNVASSACDATLKGHKDSVNALAPLPDGRLASGSYDKTIKLWNPSSGACDATLEGHAYSVTALAVLPDGRLASGSWDQTIKLWNLGNGACDATLEGHAGSVTALVVLPDGRLASGSWDNTIKLWNLGNGACDATLEGHGRRVVAVVVLPDGRLASGSWDNTIRIWEPRDGRFLGSVQFVADAGISALAFTPKLAYLAAGDFRGRLHFLALPNGGQRSKRSVQKRAR